MVRHAWRVEAYLHIPVVHRDALLLKLIPQSSVNGHHKVVADLCLLHALQRAAEPADNSAMQIDDDALSASQLAMRNHSTVSDS